jgi:hypothetical protein
MKTSLARGGSNATIWQLALCLEQQSNKTKEIYIGGQGLTPAATIVTTLFRIVNPTTIRKDRIEQYTRAYTYTRAAIGKKQIV